MIAKTLRIGRGGFTLIEMMVSMALSTIIMVGAFQIFKEGMDLHRTYQAAADAQVNITRVLGVLTIDIANAPAGLSRAFPDGGGGGGGGGGGVYPGLSFATPIGEGGMTRYDPDNGDVYWMRYICYYFVPDPEPDGFNGKIWRAWEDVPTPGGQTPPGNRDTAEVLAFLQSPSHDTNYFAASSLSDRKLLSDYISGFEVKVYDASEFAGTAGETIKLAYDVTVTAGDTTGKQRNSYHIRVSSRAVPRGAGG
jgi:prepilin-type N-terminal cleavage/methylation domain-containing protein